MSQILAKISHHIFTKTVHSRFASDLAGIGADPDIFLGGHKAPKVPGSSAGGASAGGARIEALNAPREWGLGRGCPPPQWGWVW